MPSEPTSQIHARTIFSNHVKFHDVDLPNESVTTDNIYGDISYEKLEHVHQANHFEATVTSGVKLGHIVRNTSALIGLSAALVTAIPDDDKTVSIQLKINGVNRDSALVFDNASTEDQVEEYTVVTPALNAGDIVTVEVTLGGSTGSDPEGLLLSLYIAENGV